MPSIVTASQLRSVLGVSSSLYNDAYLEGIIDTAEGVILPLLEQHRVGIASVELINNVAYFTTERQHFFVPGQSVVIAGTIAPFNGTRAVTNDLNLPYTFTQAITNADVTKRAIIPSGTATLSGSDAATLYASNQQVESAVLVVSVEVFQSRMAPGGQIEGVDFTSTPYRMGRSLYSRVQGLLGNLIDTDVLAQ